MSFDGNSTLFALLLLLLLPGEMKVVGLLSGGKDSIFNLIHCVLNHHEPIALASLGPPPSSLPHENEEIDSYMYQTVGHSGLETIAQAMGLPLVTGIIKGQAVEQGAEYGARSPSGTASEGDETEDLYLLLRKVKVGLSLPVSEITRAEQR